MPKLPPGPRGRLLSTYRVLAKPFEYIPRWHATYGDLFTINMVNGDVVMVANPEHVRAVYAAPPDLFAPFATRAAEAFLGQGSMLLLEGARHRRERKLLMPPFHGERMRVYARTMADTAARHVAAAATTGTVSMQRIAQDISLEVIVRAVFGVQEQERTERFATAVIAMTAATHPALLFMPFLQRELGGIGPFARARRCIAALDALLQEQIERARVAPGHDILSLMLAARDDSGEAMSDAEIRDELRTLLVAGHETTAITLSWAIDLLHRHPAVLARVLDEIDALGADADPESYASLPYLDAVCKEAMRLYPVVNEVGRMLLAPLQVGEYELPAGVIVMPSILLVHHRPDIYPEPEAFRPERFLDRKPSPFEYMPFGGGHRRCLGAAFASFEMKVVLATTLSRWQFRLCDQVAPVPVRRNVAIAPKGGVPVEIGARQPARAAA